MTTKKDTKKSTKKDYPSVLINYKDFDVKKLSLQPPKSGKAVKSIFLYEDKDGTIGIPYIQGLPQDVFFGEINPYEQILKKSTNPDLTGYQMTYPMRSWETKDEPTPEELRWKQVVTDIYNATNVAGRAYEDLTHPGTDEPILSAPVRNSLMNPKSEWLKPLSEYPKTTDPKTGKKVIDKSKVEKMYVKLMSYGENEKIKIYTHLYRPVTEEERQAIESGQEFDSETLLIDVSTLVGAPARLEEFVLKLQGIYWGATGQSPYVGFFQLRLAEAIVVPIERTPVPKFIGERFNSGSRSEIKLGKLFPTKGDQIPKKQSQESSSKRGQSVTEDSLEERAPRRGDSLEGEAPEKDEPEDEDPDLAFLKAAEEAEQKLKETKKKPKTKTRN